MKLTRISDGVVKDVKVPYPMGLTNGVLVLDKGIVLEKWKDGNVSHLLQSWAYRNGYEPPEDGIEEATTRVRRHTKHSSKGKVFTVREHERDVDISNFIKQGSPGGTQGAVWMKDPETGIRYVVKGLTYGNDDRVRTEVLAAAVYEYLGVPVPQIFAGTLNGKLVSVAKELVGGKIKGRISGDKELMKGFMADVFVANWDTVGLEYDNVMYHNDVPHRLDLGGSFTFRAQGGKKNYNVTPTEYKTFLDSGINSSSASSFKGIATSDMRNQAKYIASKMTDQVIAKFVNNAGFKSQSIKSEVLAGMKKRRDWMKGFGEGLTEGRFDGLYEKIIGVSKHKRTNKKSGKVYLVKEFPREIKDFTKMMNDDPKQFNSYNISKEVVNAFIVKKSNLHLSKKDKYRTIIGDYVGSSSWLNGILRREEVIPAKYFSGGTLNSNKEDYLKYIDNNVLMMDKAISKWKLKEAIYVYRGLSPKYIDGMYKTSDVIRDKGYVSTSIKRSVASSFGGQVMRIILPKGTKALYLGNDMNKSEQEVILPRYSYFKIIGKDPDGTLQAIYIKSKKTKFKAEKFLKEAVNVPSDSSRFVWDPDDVDVVPESELGESIGIGAARVLAEARIKFLSEKISKIPAQTRTSSKGKKFKVRAHERKIKDFNDLLGDEWDYGKSITNQILAVFQGKKISSKYHSTIEEYTGEGSEWINGLLRTGSFDKTADIFSDKPDPRDYDMKDPEEKKDYERDLKEYEKDVAQIRKDAAKHISKLDKVISKWKVKEPLYVYRGLSKSHLKKMTKTKTIIRDYGFVSTSVSKDTARYFGSTILKIALPKGTNALYLGVSLNNEEQEVILPRYSYFKVKRKKGNVIEAEYVKSKKKPFSSMIKESVVKFKRNEKYNRFVWGEGEIDFVDESDLEESVDLRHPATVDRVLAEAKIKVRAQTRTSTKGKKFNVVAHERENIHDKVPVNSVISIKGRVWNRARVKLAKKYKLTTHLQGALGENIFLQYLKQNGHKDAKLMNLDDVNSAYDIIFDHTLVEVKSGMVSNKKDSMKWSINFGQLKGEAAKRLKKMSDKKKEAFYVRAYDAILRHKAKVVAEYTKRTGKKMRVMTAGLILNTKTQSADIYTTQGVHKQIRWMYPHETTKFIGTVRYK